MRTPVGEIIAAPRPGMRAPELSLPLVRGGAWDLSEQRPRAFTMVVFYRGAHCPACRGQLTGIERRVDAFEDAGVEPIAVSADERGTAEDTRGEWGLERLPVAYGLDVAAMRRWGLFVSRALNDHEPPFFCEPGLFLVDARSRVYYASILNMPFGRPDPDELLNGIRYVLQTSYPARGGF